ncbi:MAG: NUDIX hydrolase [Rubricoccaceae bacterium]
MDLIETPLRSDAVYDGALLHVRRDQVRLPDGGESVREWIEHPGASAVLPLFEDGSVLLIRQFRYPPRQEFLEVPAGKFDRPNEDPLDLAKREMAEEVGLAAKKWTPLGITHPCIGYSNEVIHLFLAEELTHTVAHVDEDEFVDPVRMPLSEAVELARTGQVLDSKSALTLLLAQAELDRRQLG